MAQGKTGKQGRIFWFWVKARAKALVKAILKCLLNCTLGPPDWNF